MTCIVQSSRDWTRTSNLPVNSRLLCQLSYAGLVPYGPPRIPAALGASRRVLSRRQPRP